MFVRRSLYGIFAAIAVFAVTASASAENAEPPATATSAPASGLVDDATAGWIWHGMVDYSDSQLHGGTAHAGGAGTYGAFTFQGTGVEVFGVTGPSVTVDGRGHKLGKLKISIDGKPAGSSSVTGTSTTYDASVAVVHGLTNSLHVLQVEPDSGWIVVDYIRISGPQSDTAATADQTTPQSAGQVLPAGDYYIISKQDSRYCLASRSLTPVDGTVVELYHFDPNRLEVWHVAPTADRKYKITPLGDASVSLVVLSSAASQDGKGYQIGIWSGSGYPSAQWYLSRNEQGYFRISTVADPERVIDVNEAQMKDGTTMIAYPWHNADNQLWAFIPADKPANGK